MWECNEVGYQGSSWNEHTLDLDVAKVWILEDSLDCEFVITFLDKTTRGSLATVDEATTHCQKELIDTLRDGLVKLEELNNAN